MRYGLASVFAETAGIRLRRGRDAKSAGPCGPALFRIPADGYRNSRAGMCTTLPSRMTTNVPSSFSSSLSDVCGPIGCQPRFFLHLFDFDLTHKLQSIYRITYLRRSMLPRGRPKQSSSPACLPNCCRKWPSSRRWGRKGRSGF